MSLREYFQKLERLSVKEANRWWEARTLRQYIELERVPRGLRVMIFPTDFDADDTLLQGWEKNSAVSSRNMLEMRIAFAERCRIKHEEEIETLKQEIDSLPEKDTIKNNYAKLDKFMHKYQEELRLKKQRKLRRDEQDYDTGRVYTFAKKYDELYKQDQSKTITTSSPSASPPTSSENPDDDETTENTTDSSSEADSAAGSTSNKCNFAFEISKIRQQTRFLGRRPPPHAPPIRRASSDAGAGGAGATASLEGNKSPQTQSQETTQKKRYPKRQELRRKK